MSGHSKWHNIQQKKGKTDAQRGKIFTKLSKEISVSIKEGGADPETNTRLRLAIQKARENNMPNDNIQKALKKASGESNSINYESTSYEGYGVGGSAVIVECLTDNKNRTAGEVRHVFDKYGTGLGASGCVSYLFKRKGLIVVEKKDGLDGDELMLQAIEAGAEDVVEDEECFEIFTQPDNFAEVLDNLQKAKVEYTSADLEEIPSMYIELDEDKQETFEKMIEMLEDLDDVQEVYHNVK